MNRLINTIGWIAELVVIGALVVAMCIMFATFAVEWARWLW